MNENMDEKWEEIQKTKAKLFEQMAELTADYVPVTTGSYGDTRNYQVHPDWVEFASENETNFGIDNREQVPPWAIIEF